MALMNSSYKQFAPLGLYLSLLALIAAVGIYIVQQEVTLYLQIALALIVFGLAIFALLDPEKVRTSLTGRQARYGSNALVMGLAFTGILIALNYLAYQNPKRWDFTEDKEHTLASETIQLVQSLPEPVSAIAFFTSRYPSDQARDLLENLKYHAKGKFDYRFVDPEAEPVIAQAANITRDGTIVIQAQDRQESITYITEEQIASALIRIANPGERVIYFLSGHGEYDPLGSGDRSYSQLNDTLQSKNYTVKTLNLLVSPEIPTDAKVIVIAGPLKPISDQEVNLLKDFVARGGSMTVLLEPIIMTDFGDQSDPLASYLQQEWNITLSNDLIVDLGANPPSVAIAAEYGNHPVTEEIRSMNMATLFPTARSLQVGNQKFNPVVLIKTSDRTWAETDMAGLRNNQVSPDEGQDLLGPITIAVAMENLDAGSRLLVVGDADFAANGNFGLYGNGDLMVNSIDWTAEQDSLINLTPKARTQRFMLPPQRNALGLVLLGSVFVLPGIVLLSGIMVWVRRRRRG
jgi:ABC-type uncharacterized transport system involved in gliding motility auxiliary subunit